MMYILAIFLPPVAVLLVGKPGSFLLNIVLTICGLLPGVIHALAIVSEVKTEQKLKKFAITTAATMGEVINKSDKKRIEK